MKDKIIGIIEAAGTLEVMEEFMGKIMDSIAAQQGAYSSKEEEEMTIVAVTKFKQLYKEKLPEHAYSTLVPLYQENFTEEELDQIVEFQKHPLWPKMRDFRTVVGEKTEESLKAFTSEIFHEAFAELLTKAAQFE